MLTPKYKYTRKYVFEKVNKNKILYSFLKENKIYNKFINSCLNANTCCYYIDRHDFDNSPFMAFYWANSNILNNLYINWGLINIEFDKYKKRIYEEI